MLIQVVYINFIPKFSVESPHSKTHVPDKVQHILYILQMCFPLLSSQHMNAHFIVLQPKKLLMITDNIWNYVLSPFLFVIISASCLCGVGCLSCRLLIQLIFLSDVTEPQFQDYHMYFSLSRVFCFVKTTFPDLNFFHHSFTHLTPS
jgi:hypothetical protein